MVIKDARRNGQLTKDQLGKKVSLPKTSTRAVRPFYGWVDSLAS